MHDALRVNDHLHGIGPDREQVAGLDQFEALVHQRRRVDRDLRAHAPVRVRDCLFRRHRRQVFAPRAQEWAAGRGEQDARDARRGAAWGSARRQALEDRVVLAVDRQDGRARAPRSLEQESAREHQRFLVGQQDLLARSRGRERRRETDGADDGGHDGIRLRQRRDGGERVGSAGDARRQSRARDALREARGRGAIGESRNGGAMTLDLREQRLVIRVRGKRDDAEPFRVADGDVERRLADRARRAEDCEALHSTIPSQPKASAGSGTEEVRLSMRSSIPPCPGSSAPLSLSPCWRLNMLSSRSPTTDTSTAATHSERKAVAGRSNQAWPASATMKPATSPPSTPSQVLFGLTTGASRKRPNRLPAKYAPMSAAQASSTTNTTSSRPLPSCR